ncbi:Hypothetical protein HDN1F_36410 [gamma proteobacterium HdN1]|nr:Hypothetical protein HDN1F_36410 [gamma proteobacterium HdN1]
MVMAAVVRLFSAIPVITALSVGTLLVSACSAPEDTQQATEKLLNEKRVNDLKKGNDSLTQAREVVFWAAFKTAEDLPCFEGWLGSHNYLVTYKSKRADKPFPEFVEFTKSLIPTLDTMNTLTLELIPAAASCNGQYQEWEAPVVP